METSPPLLSRHLSCSLSHRFDCSDAATAPSDSRDDCQPNIFAAVAAVGAIVAVVAVSRAFSVVVASAGGIVAAVGAAVAIPIAVAVVIDNAIVDAAAAIGMRINSWSL